jgi:putative SOS response-associated peptidase YedK
MLRPAPATLFEAIPVESRVNTAANDDPALQEPMNATGD